MFGYLTLLKAIKESRCPRPLTHLKLMRAFNIAYPEDAVGLADLCCCPQCERTFCGTMEAYVNARLYGRA